MLLVVVAILLMGSVLACVLPFAAWAISPAQDGLCVVLGLVSGLMLVAPILYLDSLSKIAVRITPSKLEAKRGFLVFPLLSRKRLDLVRI